MASGARAINASSGRRSSRQGRSEESGSKQSRAITELQKSISDVAKNLMEGVGHPRAAGDGGGMNMAYYYHC